MNPSQDYQAGCCGIFVWVLDWCGIRTHAARYGVAPPSDLADTGSLQATLYSSSANALAAPHQSAARMLMERPSLKGRAADTELHDTMQSSSARLLDDKESGQAGPSKVQKCYADQEQLQQFVSERVDGKAERDTPLKGASRHGSALSLTDYDDTCPTCLEIYTDENPKILTKCGHAFHLACIYEWMERSKTCPVCSRQMSFDEL